MRWRVLDRMVRRLKDRTQNVPFEELQALIEETVAEVRRVARSATQTGAGCARRG